MARQISNMKAPNMKASPGSTEALSVHLDHLRDDVGLLRSDLRQATSDIGDLKLDVATLKRDVAHLPTKGWGVKVVLTLAALMTALSAIPYFVPRRLEEILRLL